MQRGARVSGSVVGGLLSKLPDVTSSDCFDWQGGEGRGGVVLLPGEGEKV